MDINSSIPAEAPDLLDVAGAYQLNTKDKKMDGQQIKQLRKKIGRTQEQLAEIIGTSRMSVIRWEHERSKPSPIFQEKLEKLIAFVEKENAY